MLKLTRNIALILLLGICSLMLISQFDAFVFENYSDISKITEHFNKEHSHRFDLSKIQFHAHKIYKPIEKINFAESSYSLFAVLGFTFLIILNFKKKVFSILQFINIHFVTSFLIPPKFS